MGPEITVSESGDLSFLREAISTLQHSKVLVGIPEAETTRPTQGKDKTVTNAGLMYIHTNGSPKRHIPARPVIEPSIEANRDNLEAGLEKVMTLELDGNSQGAEKQLALVGQQASNGAKRWFTDPRNGWRQNSPLTIARKLRTLKGRRHRDAMSILNSVAAYMPLTGTTDLDSINTPLIDTGELRRSITYVTEYKKG